MLSWIGVTLSLISSFPGLLLGARAGRPGAPVSIRVGSSLKFIGPVRVMLRHSGSFQESASDSESVSRGLKQCELGASPGVCAAIGRATNSTQLTR